MAYESGTASSQTDFFDKLRNFASTNGWTIDEYNSTTRRLQLHKGTVYVQFYWDAIDAFGMFQSLSYTGGNAPGTHPNDSKSNTQNSGTITNTTNGRTTYNIGNGPFTAYYFFTNTDNDSIYAVLQKDSVTFYHTVFGIIEKIGSWTGGEFTGVTNFDAASSPTSNGYFPFEGTNYNNTDSPAPVMHIEGLPNQVASGKWGKFGGVFETSFGTDTAGVAKEPLIGGVREGWLVSEIMRFQVSASQGFVPLLPIPVWYRDNSQSPQHVYLLGYPKDMRICNNGNFSDGQEITYGGETWKVFPAFKKSSSDSSGTGTSAHGGFAYKKIP